MRRFFMSIVRGEEKCWKVFESELKKAIAKDKTMTKQERQAWLDSLPEFVPPSERNMVKVIFIGARKSSDDRPLKEMPASVLQAGGRRFEPCTAH